MPHGSLPRVLRPGSTQYPSMLFTTVVMLLCLVGQLADWSVPPIDDEYACAWVCFPKL